MDLKRLRDPFPREDVEWRAQTVTKDGNKALALAYIDARAVSDRLDEVCGPENWQCRYAFSPDGKKTLCEIGIRCGEEWIWKADGAGDTDVEAEKGALSDAFKRAAVKWGIARYLYDLPSVWVPCESADFGGKKQFRKFTADPWTFLPGDAGRPVRPSSTLGAEQPAPLMPNGTPREQATRAEAPAGALRCTGDGCTAPLTKGQHDVSTRAFGQPLCPACQKKRARTM